MKTWQKNKGRNNWNRKRKQLIKEAVPIQPIDKPFIITKEYPNVVTLGVTRRFPSELGYFSDELIERELAHVLVDDIMQYANVRHRFDDITRERCYIATVKVLDERVKVGIYE